LKDGEFNIFRPGDSNVNQIGNSAKMDVEYGKSYKMNAAVIVSSDRIGALASYPIHAPVMLPGSNYLRAPGSNYLREFRP
jgi:hypothetical protein